MTSKDPLRQAMDKLDGLSAVKTTGRVTDLTGLILKATVPGVRYGDHVLITRKDRSSVSAEVIGFAEQKVLLMPLGELDGIGPDSLVQNIGRRFSLRCGPSVLGRVLDGLGQPMDGAPLNGSDLVDWPTDRPAPEPLKRPRITRPLSLGCRVIDGLQTVGEGQRLGLFAGSGVGKSILLGQIARCTEADVAVICLVGERGREVREFIEESLGDGLEQSVVICATSDTPPLVRLKSATVATAVAEFFRERGHRVLLLMDSITRYARALREVALAAGELPARRGYPPSVFARLPRLIERAGVTEQGSITAIYTVLVEGGDMEEPIADEVRSVVDGHVVLNRELANRGHWPAVDVLQSLSRLMPAVTQRDHQRVAAKLRHLLATYESHRDLILLGAYQHGSDPETDQAIKLMPAISSFLRQDMHETSSFAKAVEALHDLFA